VGRKLRALRGESIGPFISDCGFWTSDFLSFLFQSAIAIPGFAGGPHVLFVRKEWVARLIQEMLSA
jgi:hypothetical protein